MHTSTSVQPSSDGATVPGPLTTLLVFAQNTESADPQKAIQLYNEVVEKARQVSKGDASSSSVESGAASGFPSVTVEVEDPLRIREYATYGLARLYAHLGRASDLHQLMSTCKPFFGELPKARTAKIVRTLIELVASIPGTSDLQMQLCKECIAWTLEEKRTFLRHRVESRLAHLCLQQGKIQQGLEVIENLLKEVKKLDDKQLLVEIHLIEAKLHFSVKNIVKSKAALTAARTNANAIHCPPLLQGDIDLQAGLLHAEEKDYKTSYSYFYEAFEAFTANAQPVHGPRMRDGSVVVQSEDPRALQSLTYMVLSKIMTGQPEEVSSLLAGKNGLKYSGHKELEALKAVAKSHQERSLKMFEDTLCNYSTQIKADPNIEHHINNLYETLLEQNIQRILEPFSAVEISHVAKLIDLPLPRVLSKLSEMILDGKLAGTLDQGVGVLIVFDKPPLPETYDDVLGAFKNMATVVDTLHEKAQLAV